MAERVHFLKCHLINLRILKEEESGRPQTCWCTWMELQECIWGANTIGATAQDGTCQYEIWSLRL